MPARRVTSGAGTGAGKGWGNAALRWRTRRTGCAGDACLLRQGAPDLSGLGVVVVARNRHHILAEQDELQRRFADTLLTVDVARWVEPRDELTWPEGFLVEDPHSTVIAHLPVAIAVEAPDDARDSP